MKLAPGLRLCWGSAGGQCEPEKIALVNQTLQCNGICGWAYVAG